MTSGKRAGVSKFSLITRVTSSIHLGYRKGKSISRWVVRWRTSFSGKPQTKARILIARPNTFICSECVVRCNGIITEFEQQSARQRDGQ